MDMMKYHCKRPYDYIIPLLSDILSELWGSLLAVVWGQYDNMLGSSEVVLKEEVASALSLLSKTVKEISSPMVLALTNSFVCNTL